MDIDKTVLLLIFVFHATKMCARLKKNLQHHFACADQELRSKEISSSYDSNVKKLKMLKVFSRILYVVNDEF